MMPDEVLIEVDMSGIGAWDPLLPANDGAGRVVSTGADVTTFKTGDSVRAYVMQGGLDAEYAAVKQDEVAAPPGLVLAGAPGADVGVGHDVHNVARR
jgi:NADPH:quinone reductase-like Zn-dependent oxidoreductase